MLLTFLSVGVASAAWFYLLLLAILMVILHLVVVIEERSTVKKFSEAYRDYIKRIQMVRNTEIGGK